MNHEHTAYHGPLDIEIHARDSDRMELPDEPNASRHNAPMAITAVIVLALLAFLVVHLVGLHFKP